MSEIDYNIDFDRRNRIGFSEVIYAKEKSTEQIENIIKNFQEKKASVLATRLTDEHIDYFKHRDDLSLDIKSKTLTWLSEKHDNKKMKGLVNVVCAGTSDMPVVNECRATLHFFGVESRLIADSGVAGLDRILSKKELLNTAAINIVVAGMDGALPSVVGGLSGKPLIAVPTSVGYGASFQGLSALLAMLNSCSSGLSVVNIDNGYGAAMAACRILAAFQKA